uniref:Bm8871 n=1 Tax=Brugia malayi TaxID=6279 RepID=A0A0J9Y8Z7_BRUMA|nr:Bm8871 [Brugia malayi]
MTSKERNAKLMTNTFILTISLSLITSANAVAINSFNGNIVGDNSLNNNANQHHDRSPTRSSAKPSTTTERARYLPYFIVPPYGLPLHNIGGIQYPLPYASRTTTTTTTTTTTRSPYITERGYLSYIRTYGDNASRYLPFIDERGYLSFINDNFAGRRGSDRRNSGRRQNGGRRRNGSRRRNNNRRQYESGGSDMDDESDEGYLSLLRGRYGTRPNSNPLYLYNWGFYTTI